MPEILRYLPTVPQIHGLGETPHSQPVSHGGGKSVNMYRDISFIMLLHFRLEFYEKGKMCVHV
jgi:hypothetical protein